ncbi:MAG TPA: GDSL-type esterase/lipase family protein [Acidimicrobiia bacterium]|nr:GDSL-type esterase/lipase family protein [Acidimicrobiia bacterium]
MSRRRKSLAAVPMLPLAAGVYLVSQVLRAARRPDLPTYRDQDASGVFGDPALPTVRIVALGDSSVTAPGVEDLDDVWIRGLARSITDRYRVELISLAVGGARARDVIDGQLLEAVRLRPTVATVNVGSNDALRGVRLSAYERRLDTIVDRLTATGAGVMVWGVGDLGSIPRFPRSLQRLAASRSRAFDAAARTVALRYPGAVKIHAWGSDSSVRFYEEPDLWAGDLFHASDVGHRMLAEAAQSTFEAALAIGLGK